MKPKVVISKCLGFENCRYNGEVLTVPFLDELKERVDCIPVCPEMEIGLGMPRDPIRIILEKGKRRLVQPETGCDLTDTMNRFCSRFLNSLQKVNGFILKCRSPSCGVGDVNIFADKEDDIPIKKGSGFFANAVLEQFGELVIENEERLQGSEIRMQFLLKVTESSKLSIE